MFISDIGLQFSFFVLPLSGFGIRVMAALQTESGSVPSLCNVLKEFQKDRHQLFSKCLIEISCEAIWSWAFGFWEIFDHSFNFSACNSVVHNFYIFLVQSKKIELFQESAHFFQVIYFIAIQLFIIVSYNPLYFCIVCCNLSFFILNFVDLNLLSLSLFDESG